MSGFLASIEVITGAKSVVERSKNTVSRTSIPCASKAARYVATEGRPRASSCAQITALFRSGICSAIHHTPVTL